MPRFFAVFKIYIILTNGQNDGENDQELKIDFDFRYSKSYFMIRCFNMWVATCL